MRETKDITIRRRRKIVRRQKAMLVFAFLFLAIVILSLCFSFITNADSAQTSHKYKYYTDVTVGYGETLWDIALEYMTEEYDSPKDYIHEVQELNDIWNTNAIYTGKKLIVPYYSEELKL